MCLIVLNVNFASFRCFVADEADAVLAEAADADMLVLTVLLCAGMSSGNEIIIITGARGMSEVNAALCLIFPLLETTIPSLRLEAVGDGAPLFAA